MAPLKPRRQSTPELAPPPEAGGAMPAAIIQFGDPMALAKQEDLSLANIQSQVALTTQGDLSVVNPKGSVAQGSPTTFAPGPNASSASASSDVAVLRVLGRMAIEHERARTMHV